jgi:hypothetical membrane protein
MIASSIAYFCLLLLAMAFYPGGTHLDPSAVGYTFSGNYISDLGRVFSWSGEPNTTSRVLFTISCFVDAVFFPFFLISFSCLFHHMDRHKLSARLGCILNITASIFVCVLPFYPLDTEPAEHDVIAGLAFILSMPGTLLIAIALLSRKDYPLFYGSALLVASLVVSIYLVELRVFEPQALMEASTLVQWQKAAVFTKMGAWLLQAIGVLRFINAKGVREVWAPPSKPASVVIGNKAR